MRPMWMAAFGWVMAAHTVWAADSATRPRVAVAEFDVMLSGRTLPPPDMALSASQVMVDRLVSSGAFQVFDAHWLRRGRGGQADLTDLCAQAQHAGVDYLAVGTITQFSEERTHRGFGGGALLFPVLGGSVRRQVNLVISVLVKLVDVRSGEIVTTATGLGSASRGSVNAGALSLLKVGGVGGYSKGSDSFRDAQLGEALQRSIDAASRGIAAWRQR